MMSSNVSFVVPRTCVLAQQNFTLPSALVHKEVHGAEQNFLPYFKNVSFNTFSGGSSIIHLTGHLQLF